jgi:hypothetical protein
MKLFSSIKHRNQSFAAVLLAFSLLDFSWLHRVDSANGERYVNMVKQNEVQQNVDESWYSPPRSPGFHEDFGS